jgi:hypothetical protein
MIMTITRITTNSGIPIPNIVSSFQLEYQNTHSEDTGHVSIFNEKQAPHEIVRGFGFQKPGA